MMLALAPLVLFASSLLNVDASELSYFNPQGSERTDLNYESHGAGFIPRDWVKRC